MSKKTNTRSSTDAILLVMGAIIHQIKDNPHIFTMRMPVGDEKEKPAEAG